MKRAFDILGMSFLNVDNAVNVTNYYVDAINGGDWKPVFDGGNSFPGSALSEITKVSNYTDYFTIQKLFVKNLMPME